jgi:hypothetical protein
MELFEELAGVINTGVFEALGLPKIGMNSSITDIKTFNSSSEGMKTIIGVLTIDSAGDGYLKYLNPFSNEVIEYQDCPKEIDHLVNLASSYCERKGYNLISY